MKKSMIGIAAGAVIVATGALFATGGIAPQPELQMTNTGDKLPLISTGHDLSGARGVGILYAPTELDSPGFRADVSALLGGAPVDYFDARVATPTLAQLLDYQACFTWVNYAYAGAVAMGDVLADYVDAGGIVLLGQWTIYTGQVNWLQGRIMTEPGYLPVTPISRTSGDYAMDGVECVHAGVGAYGTSYFDNVALIPGNFSDGTFVPSNNLAVAWRPDTLVYYTPGNTGTYYSTGDWATLTANMILCAGGGCPADVNGDGVVDVLDLLAVIAAWGNLGGPEDVNGDGVVDVLDLLAVISAWGPCYPMGACCTPDGGCTDLNEVDCMIAQGDWYEGEECATFTCPELPTGACCIGTDCAFTGLEWDCNLAAGMWYEGETCPEFVCPDICEHEIVMWDDWGDGWNGGFIDVYINGILAFPGVTLATGTGPLSFFFLAPNGSTIQTMWTAGGWPYECSYYIYDGAGVEICNDGVGGVDPIGCTCTGFCP